MIPRTPICSVEFRFSLWYRKCIGKLNISSTAMPSTMPFSLRSNGHFFNLANDLYEDDNFSDILFITENGSLYGHSHLIFRHMPSLEWLMCEGCRTGHEKLVIFLPQVRPEVLEIALLQFYLTLFPTGGGGFRPP